MRKLDAVILIIVLIVAFAGVYTLFKGPGLAISLDEMASSYVKTPVVQMAYEGNLCVCREIDKIQSRPMGAGESIYDCRSSCRSQGWEFVEMRQ